MPAAADAGWRQRAAGQGYPESRAQHHRCHRTQVAGHGRLGTEIDRTMVETLDGTKNERCWSGANSSAKVSLAISTTVCRAGAAKSEMSLYTCISRSPGKPTDKFMMPVLCFNVISGEKSGSVAEDMIIDTGVCHLLEFGHQKDVRRDVCNVGKETGFLRVRSSTVKRQILSLSLLSWIRVSCHVANEESCPIRILHRNLLERETSTHLESSAPSVCCET